MLCALFFSKLASIMNLLQKLATRSLFLMKLAKCHIKLIILSLQLSVKEIICLKRSLVPLWQGFTFPIKNLHKLAMENCFDVIRSLTCSLSQRSESLYIYFFSFNVAYYLTSAVSSYKAVAFYVGLVW